MSAALPVVVACGAEAGPSPESSGNVQGGKLDRLRTHSYAVGIASREGALCSGTLIAPNLVLTARHCVVAPDGKEVVTCDDTFADSVDPADLFVTTEPSFLASTQLYRAHEIITPEAKGFCGNDIALIILAKPIPSSEAKPATPVVRFSMSDRAKIAGTVTAVGYGITSPNATDSGIRRLRGNIDIVCVPGDASYECKSTYRQLLNSEREFITEGYVCSGDSGGGAFDQTSFEKGTPYVLGALSRGPQSDSRCLAAIYSRTDAHADLLIEAGERAATFGEYVAPEWAVPAVAETPAPEPACETESCEPIATEEPAAVAVAQPRSTASCSSTPTSRSSSFGALAVIGAAIVIAGRRRRCA